MATRMQQRRGTAAEWLNADPILAAGEIGFESDTGYFKIGDGINFWFDLPYFQNSDGLSASLDDYIPLTQKGAANGVAELDATGNVPSSQLGNVPPVDLTGYATETYVDTAVSNLIDAAPGTLDTLNELAAALNDDANFYTTITNAIAAKADASHTHAISDVTNLQTTLDGKKSETSQAVSSDITAVEGYRYFVDTSAARTITLPASPALGDEVQIFDASGTAGTNNITVNNNSNKINGVLDTALLDVNGVAAVFIYTGATYGWRMG